ncbi:MAG: helix-turn-helix domain-containing protein [Bacteroidaceae bacterium]|nr:helix-turn-helix domain-containing protein [Bacteroidaceae bacterium]
MTRKQTAFFFTFFLFAKMAIAQVKWGASDGLPTGEVRQIVELPNGQMLVNCEGVFCLSNGRTFDVVPFDQSRTYSLTPYADNYGQMWQGDSLLWLRDFYRIFLFDARRRTFLYDFGKYLTDSLLRQITSASATTPPPTLAQWQIIDSIHVRDVTIATTDRQGGLWIGTRTNGIVYQRPWRIEPELHLGSDTLIGLARGASQRIGQTTFVVPLPDGRILRCDSLCHLSYFLPETQQLHPLTPELPALQTFRILVGAFPLSSRWTVIYTQNGAFMLDTQADTLAPFPHAQEIERFSSKYNCLLKDADGRLWVGTQNGLFCLTPDSSSRGEGNSYTCHRLEGLGNNCIRSLVNDAEGQLWAGTSCGISRITPTIVNLGIDDGFPPTAMMDRAALLLADGRLVFAAGGDLAVSFRPEDMIGDEKSMPVAITDILINGESSLHHPFSTSDVPRFGLNDLSHTQNYITFHFSTLNYAAPSHDRYRYRLLGLENEWNTCNNGSGICTATYKALPPGSYIFEVQSSTASDDWGPATKQAFTIHPPWWLTWWAKMLYGAIGLIGAMGLMSLYLKKKREKMERENDDRVNRLFELREEARHQFAESANIAPDKITVNAEEEKLVSSLLKAIESHIDDQQYNADLLARDVAMSRASLYKKLQTILGITPTDFIRNVRLKRAAQLLAETKLSINEIADRVGFATARNFSTSFKKMFGVLPSDYRAPKETSKEA